MTARKSKASISALRPPPVEKVSKVGARDRLQVLLDVAIYRYRYAAKKSSQRMIRGSSQGIA